MRVIRWLPWFAALLVPLFYLWHYTPLGMDTTDFGYFYGYGWRILQGQMPYRDFFYIKPALPLYWHAMWMRLTPDNFLILGGKAGFCVSILLASWFCSLYLSRFFSFSRMGLSLPLLATVSFVFSIHSFPHMPWHTADGVMFSAASLLCASRSWPVAAGLLAACAVLCKQSFAPMPLAIALVLWTIGRPGLLRRFFIAFACAVAAWCLWLHANDAWQNFRSMTTGQLDVREAIEAGILIYIRQNWLPPLLAIAPCAILRLSGKRIPVFLEPTWLYLALLCAWHVCLVHAQKSWIGFGVSWPTLFLLLGCMACLLPGFFLAGAAAGQGRYPRLDPAIHLGAALAASWCAAISGGYKIPALFAAPLVFSFFLQHFRFFGTIRLLGWGTLAAGLFIFGAAWQYPYVFPVRPLHVSDLVLDAGDVYPQASGVKIDRDMHERLAELKRLRAKYGRDYAVLPGFTLAYCLNGDTPRIASDWLIDWEINGKIGQLYDELNRKNIVVFMERDQMDTEKADNYDRAGYGVPQLVRHNWKIIDETPHFVVFQRP